MLKYREMLPGERDLCAQLAADAFFDYEYFTIYVPDDEKRRKFLRRTLDIELKINTRRVTFLVAEDAGRIVGFAILCAPGHKKPGSMAYLKAGYWTQFFLAGFRNVSAWLDMEDRAGEPCHSVGGNAWYLNLLTIAPDRKGEGIGSEMLRACVIPYARERGADALTLFTNSEDNRRFYTKNGFAEFDERWFEHRGKRLGSWSYRLELSQAEEKKP